MFSKSEYLVYRFVLESHLLYNIQNILCTTHTVYQYFVATKKSPPLNPQLPHRKHESPTSVLVFMIKQFRYKKTVYEIEFFPTSTISSFSLLKGSRLHQPNYTTLKISTSPTDFYQPKTFGLVRISNTEKQTLNAQLPQKYTQMQNQTDWMDWRTGANLYQMVGA